MPKVTQVFCGRTRNEVQDWKTPNPVRSPNTPTLGPRPEPCSASRTGNTNRVPAWRRLVDSKCKLEAPAGGTKANRSDFRTLLAKDCHQEGNDLIFSSLDLNLRKEVKTAAKRLPRGLGELRTSEKTVTTVPWKVLGA